jgi:hypothetical protein
MIFLVSGRLHVKTTGIKALEVPLQLTTEFQALKSVYKFTYVFVITGLFFLQLE